jgi:hypothetical protein
VPEARGTISTASGSVQAQVEDRRNSAIFTITGTHSAFVGVFEVSLDGSTWIRSAAARRDLPADPTSSISLADDESGMWAVPTRDVRFARLRATALGSGAVQVVIRPNTGNVVFPKTMSAMTPSTVAKAEITNWPASQHVTIDNAVATQAVSGTVNVGNLPATQAVSGVVAVSNFPASVTSVVADTELPAPAALSDAVGNPTTPSVGAAGLLWNGTQWEREQSNQYVALDASAARTTSGTGATLTNRTCRGAVFYANVTAISGTLATIAFRVQESYDGTNFRDVDTSLLQASLSALGLVRLELGPGLGNVAGSKSGLLPRLSRLAWTIGGTTPSVTFSTSAALVR